jgi:hypothetical protein
VSFINLNEVFNAGRSCYCSALSMPFNNEGWCVMLKQWHSAWSLVTGHWSHALFYSPCSCPGGGGGGMRFALGRSCADRNANWNLHSSAARPLFLGHCNYSPVRVSRRSGLRIHSTLFLCRPSFEHVNSEKNPRFSVRYYYLLLRHSNSTSEPHVRIGDWLRF